MRVCVSPYGETIRRYCLTQQRLMRPIIRVQNLGKQYRLGISGAEARAIQYVTLRESLVEGIRSLVRAGHRSGISVCTDSYPLVSIHRIFPRGVGPLPSYSCF